MISEPQLFALLTIGVTAGILSLEIYSIITSRSRPIIAGILAIVTGISVGFLTFSYFPLLVATIGGAYSNIYSWNGTLYIGSIWILNLILVGNAMYSWKKNGLIDLLH